MALGNIFRRDQGGPPKGSACIVPVDNQTTTLGSTSTVTADVDVSGYSVLTVLYRIGNATTPATAAADLTPALTVYEEDGTTIFPGGAVGFGIASDANIRTANLGSNIAFIGHRYNVVGIDKVQVRITNNNVAPLQGAKAIAYLQR